MADHITPLPQCQDALLRLIRIDVLAGDGLSFGNGKASVLGGFDERIEDPEMADLLAVLEV